MAAKACCFSIATHLMVGVCAVLGSTLPDGPWDVVNDEFGQVVRVNLQEIKDWSKVPGIRRRWNVSGPNGESRGDHAVISDIKDVDGDGKLDLFRVSNSVLMRFDEDNNRIWRSKQLNPPADDESRMPVVDLDRDGQYECVISMTDKTYCIDADTGKIKWEVGTGAEKNYSSLAVGHFDSESEYGVAVRVKNKVLFFDCHGESLRTCSFSASDTYGHCMGHADLDGDGYDEVFAVLNGKAFAVSHDGKMLWEDSSQRNHSDWICVGDVDDDGQKELLYDHDGCSAARGPIYVVNGMTGQREQSWSYSWPSSLDSNSAVIGDFRPDLPGLELARVDKRNRIELRDSTGHVIWDKIHASTGCSSGDWDGDGVLDILVGAPGHAGDGPHFSVWNGHGKRLYAIQWLPTPDGRSYGSICGPENARRVCPDFDGNGRADVLVAFGKWYSGPGQVLCLMEAAEAPPSKKGRLFFREDWKEIPPQTPVTQRHVQNPGLLLTRHGPDADLIRKSHHEHVPNDPWYVWSGLCQNGRWALSLQKKDALVDLSEKGRIRWCTKQSGKHILKVVLGLDDGTWLVSDKGFGETSDWHEFSVNLELLRWHELDIQTIKAGPRVKQPDLRRVRSVGWTDLTLGEGSSGCTRVDWIEVYGTTIKR